MIVYKYLPPSRLDVLENARIRFTQPALLNDPYETFPCFFEYAPGLLEELHQDAAAKFGEENSKQSYPQRQELVVKTLLKLPQLIGECFVVLSLSKVCNNSLMWSHYADSHRGYVIGFDSESDFFKPATKNERNGLQEVLYSDKRYVLPKGGAAKFRDLDFQKMNTGMLYTKSCDWIYEQEVRVVAHPKSADKVISNDGQENVCLFNFPRNAVKEVIFGFRIQDDFRKRLFDLIKSKYPSASIRIAMLHESEFQVKVLTFSE